MLNSRYGPPSRTPRTRINALIRASEVKVIDVDGTMLGVLPLSEALQKSQARGLDLVEVGPNSVPPIAKIMDYGKFVYEKERKEKSSKGSSARGDEIKTVKIGFRTGPHDMQVRASQIDKFLSKKYRVRVELNLRGREKGMAPLARKKLESFLLYISQPYTLDSEVKALPNGLNITLRPTK